MSNSVWSHRSEKNISSKLANPLYWLWFGLLCLVVTPLSPLAFFAALVAWAAGCALAARERNWGVLAIQGALLLLFVILLVQLLILANRDFSFGVGIVTGL